MSSTKESLWKTIRGAKESVALSMLSSILVGFIYVYFAWNKDADAVFHASMGVFISWGTQCVISTFSHREFSLSLLSFFGVGWLFTCLEFNFYDQPTIIIVAALMTIVFMIVAVNTTKS